MGKSSDNSPAIEYREEVSKIASSSMGGKRVDEASARRVFPDPGDPERRI